MINLLKWYFDLIPKRGEVGYFDPEDIGRNLEAVLDEEGIEVVLDLEPEEDEPFSGDFNFG